MSERSVLNKQQEEKFKKIIQALLDFNHTHIQQNYEKVEIELHDSILNYYFNQIQSSFGVYANDELILIIHQGFNLKNLSIYVPKNMQHLSLKCYSLLQQEEEECTHVLKCKTNLLKSFKLKKQENELMIE